MRTTPTPKGGERGLGPGIGHSTGMDDVDPGEFLDEDGRPLRRRSIGDQSTPYDIPDDIKTRGWDYQWITTYCLGQPEEAYNIAGYHEQGWRPVTETSDPRMFNGLKPPGWDRPYIERGGQRLMRRPMHLSREAARELLAIAEQQRNDKLRQAAAGDEHIRGTNRVMQGLEVEGEVGVHRKRGEG